MRLILASASERRAEILKREGYEFTQMESGCDEGPLMSSGLKPDELVQRCAELKAESALLKLRRDGLTEDTLIIASDTIVFHNGKVFGKPKNFEDARAMLSELSADRHTVYSGAALYAVSRGGALISQESFFGAADVYMKRIGKAELDVYIASGEPMGKAGAYNIGEAGGEFVRRVEGDIYTVLGFPMQKARERIDCFYYKSHA